MSEAGQGDLPPSEGAGLATREQIEAARDLYQCDEVEIDNDARVSEADDGYWVQAWVWVRVDENDEEDEA